MKLTKNERIILFSEIVDDVDINNQNLLSNALFLVGTPIIDNKYFQNTGGAYIPTCSLLINVYLNLYVDLALVSNSIFQLITFGSTGLIYSSGLIVDNTTPPAVTTKFLNTKITLPLFREGQIAVASENDSAETFPLLARNINTSQRNSIIITI